MIEDEEGSPDTYANNSDVSIKITAADVVTLVRTLEAAGANTTAAAAAKRGAHFSTLARLQQDNTNQNKTDNNM